MAAINADLWFLTETHEGIEPGKDFFSCFSGEPDRTSKVGERWVGFFSRWPTICQPKWVSDDSRCVAVHIPKSPFGELILYGSVLPWGNAWRGIPAINGQAFVILTPLGYIMLL